MSKLIFKVIFLSIVLKYCDLPLYNCKIWQYSADYSIVQNCK